MTKNKGLIITLIVLLSIIIVLLIVALVLFVKDGISFKNAIFSIGSKSTSVIYEDEFAAADITLIDVRQDAGDIVIKETTEDKIEVVVYGENEKDAQVECSKGELHIDAQGRKSVTVFGLFGTPKNDVTIYVPADYTNEIRIRNDYGECKIADFEKATVNIDCDAGNVEVGRLWNATIKCDYGNIEVKEILNQCEIKADCGNIHIDTISIQEDSSIKADLGDIEIEKANDVYIDADVSLGAKSINNNNRAADVTLKINCDCGNITVNN